MIEVCWVNFALVEVKSAYYGIPMVYWEDYNVAGVEQKIFPIFSLEYLDRS